MPELPEVEVILHQLRDRVVGGLIRDIHLGRQDIVRTGLASLPWYVGAHLDEITRKGKSLIFHCAKATEVRYLVAELGMTGLFLFESSVHDTDKHLHIKLTLENSQEPLLYYRNPRRFGRVYLLDRGQLGQFSQRRFGTDPLIMTEKEFSALLGKSQGRVKAFLLDQHKMAGIGNIYANEILHRAAVHPHARGIRLSKSTLRRLYATTQTVLKEAITWGGSTIRDFRAPDGSAGQFQKCHVVYQKAGFPCPRGCPTRIRRSVTNRSSFYCPSCQIRR